VSRAPAALEPASGALEPASGVLEPACGVLTGPGAPFDPAAFSLPAQLEASAPPEARGVRRDGVRLLVARGGSDGLPGLEHRQFTDLPDLLRAGDVLVINTSATLPASVPARTAGGLPATLHFSGLLPGGLWMVELRHRPASKSTPSAAFEGTARPGRPAPTPAAAGGAAGPTLPWLDATPGTVVELPGGGRAELRLPASASLVPGGKVRLWVAALQLPVPLLAYLARYGQPIRYPYVPEAWPISTYQTVFAEVPGSAEMPSAARPFSAELVTRLVSRGVSVAPFVLHCGVSSPEQHEPPAAEWYRVPPTSAARINTARQGGHRVVAVGTTAVRALETVTDPGGVVHPGEGWTELVVTPDRVVRSVEGLLTGWHEPGASHLGMLEAIAGPDLVAASYTAALADGYLWHEFGDSHLVLL
jgi:S-adenosylmethionine:tRNA ribosyltransferase-isomerase